MEALQHHGKDAEALGFGKEDGPPLDEEMLEHVMINRSRTRERLSDGDPVTRRNLLASSGGFSKAYESVPSELSVDRYASFSQLGDQLLKKPLDELEPNEAIQTTLRMQS